MAVSSADFYTYAKETGTPVPKSREEQAALYPAVNQWKRSRLSIPRTESKEQYLERNDLGALETAAAIGSLFNKSGFDYFNVDMIGEMLSWNW